MSVSTLPVPGPCGNDQLLRSGVCIYFSVGGKGKDS